MSSRLDFIFHDENEENSIHSWLQRAKEKLYARFQWKGEQNNRRRSSEEAERIRRTYQISYERQHKAICFEPNLLNISCNQFHHKFDSALFLNQIRWRNLLNYLINSNKKRTATQKQDKNELKQEWNVLNLKYWAKNICSLNDCVKQTRLMLKDWVQMIQCSLNCWKNIHLKMWFWCCFRLRFDR